MTTTKSLLKVTIPQKFGHRLDGKLAMAQHSDRTKEKKYKKKSFESAAL